MIGRRASTWSSSAAATPGPTAWAPPTARGRLSVHQLEIMPEPPGHRTADNPWPTWPLILRTSSAHEEGGERLFSVTTDEFVDDGTGAVAGLRGHEVELATGADGRPSFEPVAGSEFELPCQLVLLAMGFLGAEPDGVVADLGLELDARGSVAADDRWATNVDGRLRLRRHDPGPEPDRVGHRRGPLGRRRRRPAPDGRHRAAGPDRAGPARPALSRPPGRVGITPAGWPPPVSAQSAAFDPDHRPGVGGVDISRRRRRARRGRRRWAGAEEDQITGSSGGDPPGTGGPASNWSWATRGRVTRRRGRRPGPGPSSRSRPRPSPPHR